MEDAKAARSVRVWDRVPIKQQDALRKRKMRFSFSLSFHYICKLAQMYGAYGMVIDDDDTDKKTEKV